MLAKLQFFYEKNNNYRDFNIKNFTKGIYYMNIDFIIDAKRENTEIYPYDINFNLFASS